MNKKGFTLIELLVVIAIIGILASVVLASLNTARAKGADAAIKANLANMRAQAALYYDNNNSTYGNSVTCSMPNTGGAGTGCSTAGTLTTGTDGITFLNGLRAAANASGVAATVNTSATGDAWAAFSGLKTVTSAWCVDSTGVSKTTTTSPVGTVCGAQ